MALIVRRIFISVRASFWFLPALLVGASALLALVMIEVDARLPASYFADLPRLFGAGAEGSRALLSAIATSMMTVAGVVFSINTVALSLAAGQYSPHVLQSFVRDRSNQVVLGAFLGIYTYCLIVLRTVRGGDENFIPGASVVTAILLALVGIGLLIFFIHHVSLSIQVSHIVAHIARETRDVIGRVYPARGNGGAPPASDSEDDGEAILQEDPPGYVQHVDYDRLADIAHHRGGRMRVWRNAGDFVLPGQALASLYGGGRAEAQTQAQVRRAFVIGSRRNIDQDAAYGLQQLVDLACKALSPPNADTTTARHALRHLTLLLAMLAERDLAVHGTVRRGGRTVLESPQRDFADYVETVAGPFRRAARNDPEVLGELLSTYRYVAAAAGDAARIAVILQHVDALARTLPEAGLDSVDAQTLAGRLTLVRQELQALAYARRGDAGPASLA